MSLYYFLTRYLLNSQKITVRCCGSTYIMNERCSDVVRNDKYEELMKKDVVRILGNDVVPGTIFIHVE